VTLLYLVAHIDHGKSTLADRILEISGTIPKSTANKQVLDKLQVEKERGITVKAQTASLIWKKKKCSQHGNGSNFNETYLINLIDTPVCPTQFRAM
jgi:translation elongation factor EF-4